MEPGKDILLFKEKEMVDKINSLIFDDKIMEDLGRNARNVVEQYYSRKVIGDKLVEILESLRVG